MTICPCCGHEIAAPRAPIEALEAAPLPTVLRRIVNVLAEAYPRSVSSDFMIAEIYRGAREPEFASNCVSVQMARLRDKLAIYGWTVPRSQGGRGNLAGYRLAPLGAPAEE